MEVTRLTKCRCGKYRLTDWGWDTPDSFEMAMIVEYSDHIIEEEGICPECQEKNGRFNPNYLDNL